MGLSERTCAPRSRPLHRDDISVETQDQNWARVWGRIIFPQRTYYPMAFWANDLCQTFPTTKARLQSRHLMDGIFLPLSLFRERAEGLYDRAYAPCAAPRPNSASTTHTARLKHTTTLLTSQQRSTFCHGLSSQPTYTNSLALQSWSHKRALPHSADALVECLVYKLVRVVLK